MDTVTYYSGNLQELRTDPESLSKYWSIRSANMSFTYFEVPVNTEFKKHHHISEQITFVLTGELFFEADNKIYCLK